MPRIGGSLSPAAAMVTIAGVLSVAGIVARHYSPGPAHPKILRWYKSLEKPPYKPPDRLFGLIWPVLETLHSYGAYRLMRAPRSQERDAALALWLTDIAFVSGWARVFFGSRSLAGGAFGAAAIVASAAAFIGRAWRVDPVAAVSAMPFVLWSAFGGVMAWDLRERNPDLDGRDPSPLRR